MTNTDAQQNSHHLTVGILKETAPAERRVAAVPETVAKMVKANMAVVLQRGAGLDAYIKDEAYKQAGAEIVESPELVFKKSQLIVKVNKPDANEMAFFTNQHTLIAPLAPTRNRDLIQALAERKVNAAFALDLVPRIARAQSMDILSSMSNLAGYKSVILAAQHLSLIFPMLTTAAGTIAPAKIIVIGAGVAGLQAIATARRLGGVVLAFDTRPAAAEQVKSLGAEFVSLETTHEQSQDAGGYAKEQSAEFYQHEQDIIHRYIKEADAIITTALIPGKRAPLLITANMVAEMKQGAVIIDLAAEQSGNCELTEPGQTVVKSGVTIIGATNLPSEMAVNASQLFARNIYAFTAYAAPQLLESKLDLEDDIIKNTLLINQGEIIHPLMK